MRTILTVAFGICLSVLAPAQINAIPLTGKTNDDIITFVYDPVGQWWLEHPVNEAALLDMFDLEFNLTREEQWTRLKLLEEPNNSNTPLTTTLEVVSSDDFFTRPWPVWCGEGFFCFQSPFKAFHLDPNGFGSMPPSGAVPGLDGETVSHMLAVDGSWQSGGQLDMVDLRIIPFGDVNKDGLLDALDIDALTDAVFYDGPSVPLGFDLNDDGINDSVDRQIWVEDAKNTYFGDANLDGEFNSSDFVAVFKSGEYEDSVLGNSTWSDGDWNGDGEFDSSDFVTAFEGGGYEMGPRPPRSAPGDFDHDGMLDIDDINLLLRSVNTRTGDAFDVNGDGLVNSDDIDSWVMDLKNTWLGDANLDGEFNSSDFVLAFQAGKFEQDVEALWHEGDWNGDLRFNTADFVAAFADHCAYEGCGHGPRPPEVPIPEPATGILMSLAALCVVFRRQCCAKRAR